MRVALVNNFFYPRLSGSAHLTKVLATELAAQGHEVLVLCAAQGAPAGNEFVDGYRVVRLPCRVLPDMKLAMHYDVNFVFSRKNIRRIFNILDEFNPDIVHQHGQFFDLSWITAVWMRRRNVPGVMTVHTPLVHTNHIYAAILWFADQVLAHPFLRIGRQVPLAADKFMRDYIHRRYRFRLSKIAVIPLAIDVERFHPLENPELRMKLGVGDRPLLLSIGHVIPLRNRIDLIEALPEMIVRIPDIMVLIIGNILDDRFLHRARELNVEDHLLLTGAVPHHELPEYFSIASAECHELQLTHASGLGTAALEVMAAGIPVISVVPADNFPGLRLQNWENIVMVPLGDSIALADAVERLIEDPELAARVGKGERHFIEENFSHTKITEEHLALYTRLISEHSV